MSTNGKLREIVVNVGVAGHLPISPTDGNATRCDDEVMMHELGYK